MGGNTGLQQIIESLQEYSASLPQTNTTPQSANPADDMAKFFKSLTEKVNAIDVTVEKHEETATEVAAPVVKEEVEDTTKAKAMDRDEVQTVVAASVAPVNEKLDKLSEAIALMVQAQAQQIAVAQSAAPAAEAPKVEEKVVEKEAAPAEPNAIEAKFDRLAEQIGALINAMAAKSEPVEAPVEKAEVAAPTAVVEQAEEIVATTSNVHAPAYAQNPAFASNAHHPAALDLAKSTDPRAAVTSQMQSLGFIPSSPVVRRNVLGLEASAAGVEGNGGEDEVIELIKSAEDLSQMSFQQINRLRTASGAW